MIVAAQRLPILIATQPPLVHAREGSGWTSAAAIKLWR